MKKKVCVNCGSEDIRINYTEWGEKYYFCPNCDKEVKFIRGTKGELLFRRIGFSF